VSRIDSDANLLAAFALIVSDRAASATGAVTSLSPSADAALSAMLHFLDEPSLDQLRQVLGLTPSGTVRLVDRLAAVGLVSRGPGADGRSRSVALTAHGRSVARALSRARLDVTGAALGRLSASERRTLRSLVGRMMAGIVDDKEGGAWICRLCDVQACGRSYGRCPTANAAAAKSAAAKPSAIVRPEVPATRRPR
jgi:DNA-binding MarR family transcriptional regulator